MISCNAGHQPPERRKLLGFDQRILRLPQLAERLLGRILGAADFLLMALALADVDVRADPAIDGAGRVAQRNGARQERAILTVPSTQRQFHLGCGSALQRPYPARTRLLQRGRGQDRLPVVRAAVAGRRSRVVVPATVEPVDPALGVGHPHQLRNGIRECMELAFARLQGRLGALALGDLFRRHVDPDDVAGRTAQRMPIGDPESFLAAVGTLTRNLDAGHRLAGRHDRIDDGFHRVGERWHAIAHRAADVILDRDAADFGEALIDLQVAAVGRQAREADRRRIIDELQGRLLGERILRHG